jgi:hemolysin activation/secretion protein
LRYNLLQREGWFVDLTGTIEHTRSKINTSIFPSALGSDVQFWLAGAGIDMHRSDDISQTGLSFNWFESLGGESSSRMFERARTGSDSDFAIYMASASHSQYVDPNKDPNKISRLSASVRWTGSDERLAPAKMTSFGGMYSIRGYDEYEYVADGGIMASLQYEYDLVKAEELKEEPEELEPVEEDEEQETEKPLLRKLAPLVFLDYGRGKVRHPVATELGHDELFSVGGGLITELGDNFSGAVYYGYPLTATENTREGKGRVHVGMMLRW